MNYVAHHNKIVELVKLQMFGYFFSFSKFKFAFIIFVLPIMEHTPTELIAFAITALAISALAKVNHNVYPIF